MLIQVIYEETKKAARAAMEKPHPAADAVEIRLDPLGDCDPGEFLGNGKLPVVVTSRTPDSGGSFRLDRQKRQAQLERSFEAGAAYVDLEFETDDEAWISRKGNSRIILSAHLPEGMPDDIEDLYGKMSQRTGVDVLKIVPFAHSLTDNLRIRQLLKRARREGKNLAAFCMGAKGAVSRILALAWGSWATYASSRPGRESAGGQFTVEELSERFRVNEIGEGTRLLGVVGFPLGHSLSPLIHNRALRETGIDSCYLPFETEMLGEFLPLPEALNLAGFSVTLPYKETIREHLDEVDATAARLGAVNTVVKKGNRLVGSNTDVPAALRVLERAHPVKDRTVAILGAGGAGRALAFGLRERGARLIIHNRTVERARALAAELGCRSGALEDCGREPCDILINATPVGMHPSAGEMPVPAAAIRAGMVFDLVYNPRETRLLREARKKGCRTLEGLEMFLEQAADQFRMFTGTEAPLGVMRRAAEEALGGPKNPDFNDG